MPVSPYKDGSKGTTCTAASRTLPRKRFNVDPRQRISHRDRALWPGELVDIKLEFIKPFAATNATDFSFSQAGSQTNVKWTMSGDNNFIGKAFSLFMNMDKMIGNDFEKGLAQMKKVAESAPK